MRISHKWLVIVGFAILVGTASAQVFTFTLQVTPQKDGAPVVTVLSSSQQAVPPNLPGANAANPAVLHHRAIGKTGKIAHLADRAKMRTGHPLKRWSHALRAAKAKGVGPIALPVNYWAGLQFPLYGNGDYGDCLEAAGGHWEGTMSGMVKGQTELIFDTTALVAAYEKASGGDNGLNIGQLLVQMIPPAYGPGGGGGLVGNPAATISAYLDVDPTDVASMQDAIYFDGGVLFCLALPPHWLDDFTDGMVWDAGAGITPDQSLGHGVWINGIDARGYYHVETWGMSAWLTPAGVAICDPSAVVCFPNALVGTWWDANGNAPNGLSYTTLTTVWQDGGGGALPPWTAPVPPPAPPAPPAPPTPPVPVPTPTSTPDIAIYLSTKQLAIAPALSHWEFRDTSPNETMYIHMGMKPEPVIQVPRGWTKVLMGAK